VMQITPIVLKSLGKSTDYSPSKRREEDCEPIIRARTGKTQAVKPKTDVCER
jgi:hypothetical protein